MILKPYSGNKCNMGKESCRIQKSGVTGGELGKEPYIQI